MDWLIILIVCCGFFLGYGVMHFVKSERKDMEKWIKFSYRCSLFLSGAAIAYFAWGNIWYFIFGLLIGYFLKYPFAYLGIGLGFGHEMLLPLSIFGLLSCFFFGSLESIRMKYSFDKVNVLVLPVVLVLVFSLGSYYLNFTDLMMFASGALVIQWWKKS